MKLSDLEDGKKCIIESINLSKKSKRLIENVGVTVGAKIAVIRRAPLLDPIEIKVRGFYAFIRVETAKKIWVKEL